MKKIDSYFDNLATKKKFFIAFGSVALVFLFVLVWTLINIAATRAKFIKSVLVEEVKSELENCRAENYQWILSNINSFCLSKNKEKIESSSLNKFLKSEQRTIITNQYPRLKNNFENLETQYKKLNQEIKALHIKYQTEENKTKAITELNALVKNSLTDKAIILLLNELEKETAKEKVLGRPAFLLASILVLTLLAVLVTFLLVKILVRQTIAPINSIAEFAKKLEKGDVSATINMARKDEFGDLAKVLNQMINQIHTVITSITENTNNFARGSQEFYKNSIIISEGVSRQLTSTSKLAAAMEQIVKDIKQNNTDVEEADILIYKIAENMEESNTKVTAAAQLVKQIVRKIKVVDDIAFQTNILSINASIEAHRAGVQGRGFGIVASEIGHLAENSKKSANEIEKLSQQSYDTSLVSAELIESLVPEVGAIAQLILDIALSSSEQTFGVEQAQIATQELTGVTNKSAIAVEQMVEKTVSLTQQANNLKELITFFKVK